jgi:hypothetical protein
VHKLVRNQLPDKAMFKPVKTQGKIIAIREPWWITTSDTLNYKDDCVNNQQHDGKGNPGFPIRVAHIITIFNHCCKN